MSEGTRPLDALQSSLDQMLGEDGARAVEARFAYEREARRRLRVLITAVLALLLFVTGGGAYLIVSIQDNQRTTCKTFSKLATGIRDWREAYATIQAEENTYLEKTSLGKIVVNPVVKQFQTELSTADNNLLAVYSQHIKPCK